MDLLYAVVGLVALLGAGDALVRGAVALSLRLGVPALIVSLTIIAFGTSAPELLISIKSALEGAPGIAYGNVVGSNIANVLLVLGVPALISTIDGRDCDSMRNYILMLFASVVFIGLCALGPLHVWHGLVLLAILAFMLGDAYASAVKARAGGADDELAEELAELEDADPNMDPWKICVLIAVGLIGLPFGAHLLVDGARGIALAAGVSEAAIGLTLVAVGTSLPELATTVMAAMRRQADVAIGNVIGSNLFNLVAIMGVASFFGPLPVPDGFLTFDLWIMLGVSLLLLPFICRVATMGRWVGFGFLVMFGVYIAVALAP